MPKVTEAAVIIDLLQDDIRGEHAAIMQYLQHAYHLPEGELPAEIEEIAREEMRHFRWLCEMVVDLGGTPTIERDPIFLEAPTDVDLLRLDIDAEERAIAQYRDHIERIDHSKVVRLLERILADELAHRSEFGDFVEELGGENAPTGAVGVGPWGGGPEGADLSLESPADEGPFGANEDGEDQQVDGGSSDGDAPLPQHVRLIERLNQGIRAEYATILRQLQLSFVTKDSGPKLSKELLESHATWHMKHMGWMSERVADLGGTPESDHNPVVLNGRSVPARVDAEAGRQREHLAELEDFRSENDDEKTDFILGRMIIHEDFAAQQLDDLANDLATGDQESKQRRPLNGLTVGDLYGRPQP